MVSASGDGDEAQVCHLIDHHFLLKQLLEFRFQMATVLSIS